MPAKPFRIYLSHTIRGTQGDKATPGAMRRNMKAAVKAGECLEAYFLDWEKMYGLCKIELYVPGAHDAFPQAAMARGWLSIDQVLDLDCDIIDTCDMMLVRGNYLSTGMIYEIDHASQVGIPTFQFDKVNKKVMADVYDTIHLIIKGDL